jgi:hypothetical protein
LDLVRGPGGKMEIPLKVRYILNASLHGIL